MDPKKHHHAIDAYHKMLNYLKEALPHFEEHSVEELFEKAQAEAQHLGELTAEEAREIAGFLRRDLHDAAHALHETEEDLATWVQFDIALIEDKLWQAFSQVADKSAADQLYLKFRAERGPVYRCGEITGVGTLQCEQCGELVQFQKVTAIAPCAKCGNETFARC
jgi:predicted ATP-dependent protease